MGIDKAAIVIDGRTMADRVADALAAAGAHPVLRVDAATDLHPGDGPVGGVITALSLLDPTHDLVAVLACDLLSPEPSAIVAVVSALAADPVAAAAVPSVDGDPQWMHAVWRRSLAGRALADAFADGARSFAAATSGLVVLGVAGLPRGTGDDADTPDDLPPGAGDDLTAPGGHAG